MRFFLFLVGFGLSVVGGIMLITYLNLVPAGYTYRDYIWFIRSRPECYFLLVGLAISSLCIYHPTGMRKNNER